MTSNFYRLGIVIAASAMAVAGQAIRQTSSGLNSQDKTFIQKAAQGGLAEVKLGQLASQKGQAKSVRDFGMHMVKDHSAANGKLTSIAKSLKAEVPTTINATQSNAYKRLQSLSGSAFDKAYSAMMVHDHHEDIDLFQKEAKSGGNAKLKTFASQTLPTLQHHLSMTKNLPK